MFTEQVEQFNRLEQIDPSTPEGRAQWVQTMRSVLGQCMADLVHRGSVHIDASGYGFQGNDAPSFCVNSVYVNDGGDPYENVPAKFKVTNPAGQYNPDTTCIDGGLAAYFGGPVAIGNSFHVSETLRTQTTNIFPSLFVDNARFNLLQVLAIYNWQYQQMGVALWGVCTTNWPASGEKIVVNPCDDRAGTNPTADEHTVYLFPEASACMLSPNLVQGQVIPYYLAKNGEYISFAGMDMKVGTMLPFARAIDPVPQGWALMDGTANAAGNGGSGIDMTDRFPMGTATAGEIDDTGGADTHSHTVTVDAHTSAQVAALLSNHTKQQVADALADHDVSSIVSAISVDDHAAATVAASFTVSVDPHDGSEVAGCIDVHDSTGMSTVTAAAGGDVTALALQSFSHTDVALSELTHSATVNAGTDLEHNVTASGASPLSHGPHATNDDLIHAGVAMATLAHTNGATSQESNLPPYVKIFWYERLDNSA